MKTTIYNTSGKESGSVELPESIFSLPWNADLVHQVITSMDMDRRTPVAHTKTRGEVSGGGKKPWKQKGTGRARHGSSRSPLWVGGGVTFGPRNDVNFSRKVNKKMKTKALFTILSQKLRDGQVLFVDSIKLAEPKTAEAKKYITGLASVKGFEELSTKKKNNAFITSAEYSPETNMSFSNFNNIKFDEVRNLNPVDVMNYKYIVIEQPEESIKTLLTRLN